MLEPEVMDTEEDAVEYDAIPNDSVNLAFVEEVLNRAPKNAATLIDLGAGPAHIAILFALKNPKLAITTVELADNMIAIAKKNIAKTNIAARIRIAKQDVKNTTLKQNSFDIVVSNSVVHHIHHPLELFVEAKRLASENSVIYFKDLLRPKTTQELDHLVEKYAADVNGYQRTLFRNSLQAALSLEEVKAYALSAELSNIVIEQTSDRHWSLTNKKGD